MKDKINEILKKHYGLESIVCAEEIEDAFLVSGYRKMLGHITRIQETQIAKRLYEEWGKEHPMLFFDEFTDWLDRRDNNGD